jgi:hypothetical protein
MIAAEDEAAFTLTAVNDEGGDYSRDRKRTNSDGLTSSASDLNISTEQGGKEAFTAKQETPMTKETLLKEVVKYSTATSDSSISTDNDNGNGNRDSRAVGAADNADNADLADLSTAVKTSKVIATADATATATATATANSTANATANATGTGADVLASKKDRDSSFPPLNTAHSMASKLFASYPIIPPGGVPHDDTAVAKSGNIDPRELNPQSQSQSQSLSQTLSKSQSTPVKVSFSDKVVVHIDDSMTVNSSRVQESAGPPSAALERFKRIGIVSKRYY